MSSTNDPSTPDPADAGTAGNDAAPADAGSTDAAGWAAADSNPASAGDDAAGHALAADEALSTTQDSPVQDSPAQDSPAQDPAAYDPNVSAYQPGADPAQPSYPAAPTSVPPNAGYIPYGTNQPPVTACQYCGVALPAGAVACGSCQAPVMVYAQNPMVAQKDKLVAGLLAIFVGGFGVHKFYLGYNRAGGILLGLTVSGMCLSILFIGLLWVWVPGVIALIEGIIYLTKSDYDFQQTYVIGTKEWF